MLARLPSTNGYIANGGRDIAAICRRNNTPRRKRRKHPKGKRQIIPNRIGIEMRPIEINNNSAYGHCEADTIVSGKKTASKAALAVVCQMKSKYLGIQKISSMKPAAFKQAIWKIKKRQTILSLTMDNGLENREHEQFGVPTYFCEHIFFLAEAKSRE